MIFDMENILPDWYPKTPWEKHFALLPVSINDKWYWFTYVYKRRVDYFSGSNVEYGTILDVLKESNESF